MGHLSHGTVTAREYGDPKCVVAQVQLNMDQKKPYWLQSQLENIGAASAPLLPSSVCRDLS